MKRKTRGWVIGGVALFAIGAVGLLFQDDDSSEAEAEPKPSVTESAKERKPEGKPSQSATGSGVPSPDPVQRAKLLRALGAVDPGLVSKEDRAVSRARNVCLDIKNGVDTETLHNGAKLRYEGGSVPFLTAEQSADIVTAVRSSFCH